MTKMALITTTIQPSEVLRLYRKFGPDIPFFVTGDKKTPHEKLRQLAEELYDVHYYDVEDQEKLGYKTSDVIGWNTIRRRNIALLEALRYGAEKIITVDVDNYPMSADYFSTFDSLLSRKFNGLMVDSRWDWFNVGDFFIPRIHHRGFPLDYRDMNQDDLSFQPIVDAKIGVAAGLWFGDPDVGAMERIINHPMTHQISQLLQRGIIVKRGVWSPFDSQNTAFLAELAPLMMMLDVWRYDDIWASYLTQRVMGERGYHIHYGPPFVWQERNRQSLLKNLEAEIFGLKHTLRFCSDLLKINIGGESVLDDLHVIYEELPRLGKDYLPKAMLDQFGAWLEDLETVR